MEINKLIDFYDREQKILFTSFCITLPLSYTVLYTYIDSFKSLELIPQIAFSMSSSICATTISFICVLIAIVISNIDRKIRLFHTVLPQIGSVTTSLVVPNLIGYGIYYPVLLFLMFCSGIVISHILIFKVFRFTYEEHQNKGKFKNKY